MRRLIPALAAWLQNPVIKISPSDELVRLRQENQRLTAEAERLTKELHRVERLYYDECTVNMRLTDTVDKLTGQLEEEERRKSKEVLAAFRKNQ